MKQFPLIEDWSLGLHARDNGDHVGAILRSNILYADFLCLVANERAFALLRFPGEAENTDDARRLRRIFEPGRIPLDTALQRAVEETLSHELGMPTQLVLAPPAGVPVRYIVVPPASDAR